MEPPAEALSPVALADRIRAAREAAAAAETEVLMLAAVWADAHPEVDEHGRPIPSAPVADEALAAHFVGIDPEDETDADSPGWAGLPPVAWDAPAGLAAACGFSTHAGRGLLRDALVLRHRLPRVWRRLVAGQVPAWRARRIAQEVAGAPDDVVAAIDVTLAPVADRVGPVTLRRLVGEAMIRLYPEHVEAASLEALDARFVRFDRGSVNHTGVARMDIRADYADLDDLDNTLDDLAKALAATDHESACESADVRRARALGVLADPGRAHRLLTGEHTDCPDPGDETQPAAEPGPGSRPSRRSRVRLELRITDLGLLGLDPAGQVAGPGVPGGAFTTLTERIATWCGRDAADLTVLPVLDPDAHTGTPAYQVRHRLRDHIDLRDRTCRFPFCTHPARACDHDHVTPYDPGGAGGTTCSCNLVALCRHHHRLKTSAGYRVTTVEPGVAWWTTPHGHEFLVDHHGTLPIHRAPPDATGCLQDH